MPQRERKMQTGTSTTRAMKDETIAGRVMAGRCVSNEDTILSEQKTNPLHPSRLRQACGW